MESAEKLHIFTDNKSVEVVYGFSDFPRNEFDSVVATLISLLAQVDPWISCVAFQLFLNNKRWEIRKRQYIYAYHDMLCSATNQILGTNFTFGLYWTSCELETPDITAGIKAQRVIVFNIGQ